MLIRVMLFALALLPLPAAAQNVEENEALVMRLIFDDCLGFVTDGTEPFTTTKTETPTPDEIEQLGFLPDPDRPIRLIRNGTYLAMWGGVEDTRVCIVTTNRRQILASKLIVRQEDFFEQMTLRAGAFGLGVGAGDPEDAGVRSWVLPGVPEGEGLTIFLQFDITPTSVGLDTFGVMMPLPDPLN